MTEESLLEILNKHISYSANSDVHQELPSILSAIKEAIRIESIGFAEWIQSKKWIYNFYRTQWQPPIDVWNEVNTLTTDQLYTEWRKINETITKTNSRRGSSPYTEEDLGNDLY